MLFKKIMFLNNNDHKLNVTVNFENTKYIKECMFIATKRNNFVGSNGSFIVIIRSVLTSEIQSATAD